MIAKDLRAFRKRQQWSQAQMADMLNVGMGRKYEPTMVSRWERGAVPVPKGVAAFIETIQLEQTFGGGPTPPVEPPPEALPLAGEPPPVLEEAASFEDTAPPPPPLEPEPIKAQLPLPGSSQYARVCEELWEMVATGIGLIGAATGSDVLKRDGQIILADKAALGRAYGKLAETNDTFRRMLVASTGGGAWLEVALVSGLTAGKIMRNHQVVTVKPTLVEAPPVDDGVVSFNGDGAVVTFPHPG